MKERGGINASSGEIWLYDPNFLKVGNWDATSLLCLDHNVNDGLKASKAGIRHSIKVAVAVGMMEKAGEHRFVLSFIDSHADHYKNHQVKPALEMNQTAQQLPPIVYIRHGSWHVAWRLSGRSVNFRTVRANPAEVFVYRVQRAPSGGNET